MTLLLVILLIIVIGMAAIGSDSDPYDGDY